MIQRSFALFGALALVLCGLHLWHSHSAHEHFGETLSRSETLPPPVLPSFNSLGAPPPPLESAAVDPPKKHFWQRNKEAAPPAPPEPLETSDETVAEQAPLRPRNRPDRASYALPLPDAHFSGVKLILWDYGCPRGEKALRDGGAYCPRHGATLGSGPQCDVWVIRVPHDSEPRCPRFEFYYDGRHVPPDMIGYGGLDQWRFILARIPRCPADWYRPAPGTASSGHSAPNYGPGIGIRYKSDTDVGLGLGFGSGWAPNRSGGCP